MDHDKPTLILTVGLPRSGKSTWARQQGSPIVCPDAIRLSLHGQAFLKDMEPYVWAIAHTMVKSLFHAGHQEVILDATNINTYRRKEWVSPEWRTKYVQFDVSPKVCKDRARRDGRDYLVPVIDRMYKNLVWVDSADDGILLGTYTSQEDGIRQAKSE